MKPLHHIFLSVALIYAVSSSVAAATSPPVPERPAAPEPSVAERDFDMENAVDNLLDEEEKKEKKHKKKEKKEKKEKKHKKHKKDSDGS